MFDGEEAVKQLEGHCRYCEEIEGHDHLAVISQECEPALAWISLPSNTSKIPSHSPFRDVEAELLKLAVDLRSAPVRILICYAADHGSNLDGDLRPSSCTRAPAPVEPETGSVPPNHGLRLYNNEGLGPPRPQAAQNSPEQPVQRAQAWAWMFSFEHCQMLTQSEDLKCAVAATTE